MVLTAMVPVSRRREERVDKRLKRILEIVNMLAKHLGLVGRGSS